MIFKVTDLDQILWYRRLEDMTQQDLIDRLTRKGPVNEKMLTGTAWHDILENPPDEITTIDRHGVKFRIDCDAEITLPQIREIRGSKQYEIDGQLITLSGGCDGITGNKVSDHKLTFRPKPETYFESYQWRAYLDIFGADSFEYILYHAVEGKDEVVIKDISTITMYPYPGMIDDLKLGIADLALFVRENMPGQMVIG